MKWFSLMRNEVEKRQMVWGDHKRFNPLRDIKHFAEPPKIPMSNGTAKCQMEQPSLKWNSPNASGSRYRQMIQCNLTRFNKLTFDLA